MRSEMLKLAGDFLVGQIFQQRVEHFLFAAAEFRGSSDLQAPAVDVA